MSTFEAGANAVRVMSLSCRGTPPRKRVPRKGGKYVSWIDGSLKEEGGGAEGMLGQHDFYSYLHCVYSTYYLCIYCI